MRALAGGCTHCSISMVEQEKINAYVSYPCHWTEMGEMTSGLGVERSSSSSFMHSAARLKVSPLRVTYIHRWFSSPISFSTIYNNHSRLSSTLAYLRAPFGRQIHVVTLDLLLNPFDRLEVFDGLDVKLSGCVFVYNNQGTWVQLQCG